VVKLDHWVADRVTHLGDAQVGHDADLRESADVTVIEHLRELLDIGAGRGKRGEARIVVVFRADEQCPSAQRSRHYCAPLSS
jgi:hypothetical protein